MRPAPQGRAGLAGEAPQVGARTHGRPEARIRGLEARQRELPHLDRARSEVHDLAPAGASVGALAADFHRRVGGRPLQPRPAQLGERRRDLPLVEGAPPLGSRHHIA